ncbi:MAG: ribokinase [Firmicutes bacterium HGW-Firmicutes-7]|nr:MAG: ribokinase [Firmicutes bacterium HGW-Firmicutes-7]
MAKKVTVFGSFVVDLMARTPHLPVPGETVKGSMFKMGPGGKGFNQGVAAHKAGATVSMITKLGKDTFANVALDAMKELNMDTSKVFITEKTETGSALILVDEKTSQNEIVVVLGACNTISDEEVDSIADIVKDCEYLLTQLETNTSAIERVIDIAYKNKVKVILNTAPIQPISDDILGKVDLITPNEVEAEILTGICIDGEENAKKAAAWFFAKGVKNVLITLGGRGVFIATKEKQEIIPAYKVNAIDTTGAGDAFNGGLVAALAEGKDLWEAAKFANALAAIAVQRLGTTPAMPTRVEIDEFIAKH